VKSLQKELLYSGKSRPANAIKQILTQIISKPKQNNVKSAVKNKAKINA